MPPKNNIYCFWVTKHSWLGSSRRTGVLRLTVRTNPTNRSRYTIRHHGDATMPIMRAKVAPTTRRCVNETTIASTFLVTHKTRVRETLCVKSMVVAVRRTTWTNPRGRLITKSASLMIHTTQIHNYINYMDITNIHKFNFLVNIINLIVLSTKYITLYMIY